MPLFRNKPEGSILIAGALKKDKSQMSYNEDLVGESILNNSKSTTRGTVSYSSDISGSTPKPAPSNHPYKSGGYCRNIVGCSIFESLRVQDAFEVTMLVQAFCRFVKCVPLPNNAKPNPFGSLEEASAIAELRLHPNQVES